MSKLIRVRSLALASLIIAPACVDMGDDDLASSDSADTAISASICPLDTPASLAPAADQNLAFALPATGVQKYTCQASGTGAAWTFVAPDAKLFDSYGRQVGTHFAGPTWQYKDGSTVVGAKVSAATLDLTAVPWLLLSAASHGPVLGKMTNVTTIQRLSTTGGNAPTTGCDTSHLGATADVPYTAKYFFYYTNTRHMERNIRCGATL
jgi:hypothetical protein